MVRNIVIVLILVLVGVPSWQIGGIMLQKKQVSYLLQEQANSIKRYQREDLVRKNLKDQLETMGLPSNFTLEVVRERREVKIRYRYQAAASVFNYTYYEVKEPLEAVTQEGVWDS